MESSTLKRVGLIHLQPSLSTVPCLMSLIALLARSGYCVDVFTFDAGQDLSRYFSRDNVNIYCLRGYYGKNLLKLTLSTLFAGNAIFRQLFRHRREYKWLVGVHLPGLAVAFLISHLIFVPFAYHNLELYFRKELKNWIWRLAKYLEICFSRKACLVITLDNWHARLLAQENGLSKHKIVTLPNSPPGNGLIARTDYFREKYHLPAQTRIILTMGSRFTESRHQNLVLESVGTWPKQCVLVIHRGKIMALEENRQNVFLSNDFIPFEQLENLHAASDIGLVLYQNDDRPAGGRNQTYMGFSSGQFNLFMKCGIPCITSSQRTFKWIFRRYKCGIALPSLLSLDQAIREILSSYDLYSYEAVRCYNHLLNFEAYFSQLQQSFLLGTSDGIEHALD